MKKLKYKFIDFAVIIFISAICWEIASFMMHGTVLNPGYEDWMAHAYRVELLERYGLTSWIHNWSNGISVWNSYQFLPHYLTLLVVTLFSIPITTAMIYLTIFQFIFLRVSLYVILRALRFSVLTSLLVSLLSLSIAQYWEGVNDYSLLFGFTLFPLLLWFWIKYYNNKLTLLYPYICGLSFYIHPLLGISLCSLWLLGNIISSKAILSKNILIETVIILLTSSLFWLPVMQSAGYTFRNPYLASQEYLAFILKDYEYFGLNIYIILLFICSFFAVLKQTNIRNWTKVMLLFALGYLVLVILGTQIGLPSVISQLQFTRGVFFIGIAMLFIIASLIQEILFSKYMILKVVLAFVLATAFVDGLWYATIHSPIPEVEQSDPLNTLYKTKTAKFTDGRIWSPHIGSSSYYAAPTDTFSYSYMGHLEPNQVAQRLGQHLLYSNQTQTLTVSSTHTINSYLQLTGTKYVLLDHNNAFSDSFVQNNQQNIDSVKVIESKNEDYDLITMSWPTINARVVSADILNLPAFPKHADIGKFGDQKQLDDLVNVYQAKLSTYKTVLPVIYAQNDEMQLDIPEQINAKYLFINESYDPDWKAMINNTEAEITSFGPNFMLVTLPDNQSGTLILKHSWPITHWISLFFIFIIGLSIPLYNLGKKLIKK